MGLRLNFHGLLGVVLIAFMFGIAYSLHWIINWFYFAAALLLYAIVVIPLTASLGKVDDSMSNFASAWIVRLLFSCHCALIFLAIGLLAHFPDNGLNFLYFITGAAAGFSIPFSVVRINSWRIGGGIVFSSWGIFGSVAVIFMFGIAFYYRWAINLLYFVAAILLYSIAILSLTLNSESYHSRKRSDPYKLLYGCYLALAILAVGLYFRFEGGINLFYFIGGAAAGLAIPYLLIRG